MKFCVLLDGNGGGCDYSMACNKMWEMFEAETLADAQKKVKKIMVHWGNPYSNNGPAPEIVTLLQIAEFQEVDVKGYWDEYEANAIMMKVKKDKEKRKDEYEKLKAEFGDG